MNIDWCKDLTFKILSFLLLIDILLYVLYWKDGRNKILHKIPGQTGKIKFGPLNNCSDMIKTNNSQSWKTGGQPGEIEICVFLDKRKKSRLCSGGSSSSSIVFSHCNGRLGNQLSSLATLMAFHRQFGVRPHLLKSQKTLLENVFEEVKFPVMEGVMDDKLEFREQGKVNRQLSGLINLGLAKKKDFIQINLRQKKVFSTRRKNGEKDHSGDYYYDKFMENPGPFLKGHIIDIGLYPNALFFYKKYLPYIKEELVIKKIFLSRANNLLRDISKRYSGQQLIFVGVHIRRTDYEHYLKGRSGGNSSFVNKAFFSRAMDQFRATFKNKQVVFVVVSDDVEWVTKNLGNGKNVHIGSRRNTRKTDGAGTDLGLLSLCNHTILTYGTFGQWGALMAGGTTILPRGYSQKVTKEIRVIERAALSNWTFIQV